MLRSSLLIFMGVLIPWFSLGLGFWVAFVRPRDPLAWIFLGLTISFGHFLFSSDGFGIWPSAITAALLLFHGAWQAMFFVFLFLFGLYFPFEWGWSARWWWLKWILLFPLLANVVIGSASNLASLFAGGSNLFITVEKATNKLFLFFIYASFSCFFLGLV